MRSLKGRNNESGASLVEFAFVAPLLFLLLFGVVEFSRLIGAYTTVWTSAREGARYATTSGDSDFAADVPRFRDCDGILDAVQALAITSGIDDSDVSVTWTDTSGTVVADCDTADATVPDPATRSDGVWVADIPSGSTVSVEVRGSFESVTPLIGGFIDGASLDSTQSRSIYEGIVGGS